MSLLVICPTRGRPQKAVELLEAFHSTAVLHDTALVFAVDEDDPLLDDYLEVLPAHNVEINTSVGFMGTALQAAASLHAEMGIYTYLGFMGDDHRPRTKGWDRDFSESLAAMGGGFAYGNDLYQSANLPTHIVMNASIVKALGWMAPPELRHLYFDDTWKLLGEAVNRLFYFPEVIIEHVHPYAGKSEMDAGYERVNSREMDDHDRGVFEAWKQSRAHEDIETVRRVLGL